MFPVVFSVINLKYLYKVYTIVLLEARENKTMLLPGRYKYISQFNGCTLVLFVYPRPSRLCKLYFQGIANILLPSNINHCPFHFPQLSDILKNFVILFEKYRWVNGGFCLVYPTLYWFQFTMKNILSLLDPYFYSKLFKCKEEIIALF